MAIAQEAYAAVPPMTAYGEDANPAQQTDNQYAGEGYQGEYAAEYGQDQYGGGYDQGYDEVGEAYA